jgi:hypothetical protein
MTDTTAGSSAPRSNRFLAGVAGFVRQQPVGAFSLGLILAMLFASIFAPWVAPYHPLDTDFMAILSPPSWEHLAGTDTFGRDVFSRLIHGARTALVIGITASLLGCSVGAFVGAASAYFGGRTDAIIQRIVDLLLSFPLVVLALVIAAVLGRQLVWGIDMGLVLAIAIPIVPQVSRVIRASALSIRSMAYIDAARVAGYPASHGAEPRGAVPDHGDGLRGAGDPAGGVAVIPRAGCRRTDSGLGAHAVGQRDGLLHLGAVAHHLPRHRHLDRGDRIQPLRRRAQGLAGPEVHDVGHRNTPYTTLRVV